MNTLVVAYDESADARRALEHAVRMFPDWCAIVVHVWSSSLPAMPSGLGAPLVPDTEVLDDSDDRREAQRIVEDGVARSGHAGLAAQPVLRHVDGISDVATAVLAVAQDQEAQLIVAGRRGLGRVRAAVLGSVSDALVRDTAIPVLIVPNPD